MADIQPKIHTLIVNEQLSNDFKNDDSDDNKHKEKLIGIQRIEIISSQYGKFGTSVVFLCIFLVSYCYRLDSTVRHYFQAFAQSSYGHHSLLATVNTATAIIAVAAQPFFCSSFRLLWSCRITLHLHLVLCHWHYP